DSVKQIDVAGNQLPGYNFTYSPVQLPIFESYAQDYWGFYNGASTNTKLLIFDEPLPGNNANPPSTTYGANRNVQPDSMMAGMLQKITFPTGGYSVFTYEPNLIGSTVTGGIRIKKIVSYDGNGGGLTKTYKYSQEQSISNLYNGDISNLGSNWEMPYRNLEPKYPGDMAGCWRTFVTYLESFPLPIGSSSGAAVCYGQVEEYSDSSNGQGGKTVYTYSTTQDQSPSLAPQNIVTNEWDRGRLLTELKYKSNGSGGFVLLSTHVNNYTFKNRNYDIKAIVSRAGTLYQNCPLTQFLVGSCTGFDARNAIISVFNPYTIGNEYVTQTVDIVYDQNGANPQTTTVNYFFDDTANILPTRTETIDSRGTLVRSYQWYPLEKHQIDSALTLSTTASIAIDSLVSKNILTPVIDQETYYGGMRQKRIRTNYKVFGPNLIKPSVVQGQFGSNPIEDRLQFTRYDAYGNLISGAKVGDAISTFIMDYKRDFVIASAIGADSADVAYTSFEADGKGNWTFAGTPGTDPTAPTGGKSYPAASVVSKSGLTSATTYIVSMWCTGSPSVSGTVSSKSVWTLGSWTYKEFTVTGITSVTISGTGNIDELRLYPANAQMTTYTYSPLIGVTASSDANGRLTTYQYDSFNRLVSIKDQDGNILKTVQYHYKGQTF
ncbi:MAG TPA: RHS repeat domain-containing protein, partial [Puia sp.]|nr:RHS repeat domain-containing protein [Puia sp.]